MVQVRLHLLNCCLDCFFFFIETYYFFVYLRSFYTFPQCIFISGGESQKVAMARSFYRKTDLIALDEPTSALDVISEDKMYNGVAKYSEKEMLLFISHSYNVECFASCIP